MTGPAVRLRLLGVLLLAAGCGEDDLPPVPPAVTSMLHEPPAFCFGGNDTVKTLTLYNLGDAPLTWTPLRIPAGASGLEAVVVDPVSTREVAWSWNPAGPYPVLDSLIAATNDPDREEVVIPVRRDAPGAQDLIPPAAPILWAPEDGAEFAIEDSTTGIEVAWSELDDCSGIRHYRLEISLTPGFGNIVCCPDTIPGAAARVYYDAGDEGVAYWRVYAVDGAGLRGPPSEPRSWFVR